MGYRLEVSYSDGVTLEALAIRLASALNSAIVSRRSAEGMRASAANERRKAAQLQGVLFQLDERKRNPPQRVRRMDPMSEYDEDMVRRELADAKRRADEFTEKVNELERHARARDEESAGLQRAIAKKQAENRGKSQCG